MPIGIQRMRIKGWRAPEGAVYVGRPSRWGNLWVVGLIPCGCRNVGECEHNLFRVETAEEAVELHEKHTTHLIELGRLDLSPLRGKDLMDWCRLDRPCHRNILLRFANA
jgi:hypothetical protein